MSLGIRFSWLGVNPNARRYRSVAVLECAPYRLSLNATPVCLSKLHKFMTLSLGKLLYPNLQPDQRQREMHVLLTTLLTGLITAGIIALVMIVMGKK
jgi:hypothetical protein